INFSLLAFSRRFNFLEDFLWILRVLCFFFLVLLLNVVFQAKIIFLHVLFTSNLLRYLNIVLKCIKKVYFEYFEKHEEVCHLQWIIMLQKHLDKMDMKHLLEKKYPTLLHTELLEEGPQHLDMKLLQQEAQHLQEHLEKLLLLPKSVSSSTVDTPMRWGRNTRDDGGQSEREVPPSPAHSIAPTSPGTGLMSDIDLSSPLNYGTPSSLGSIRTPRSGIRGTPIRMRPDVRSDKRIRQVNIGSDLALEAIPESLRI
ncbi:hypothetical protein NQ317_013346, partial [Molorchus minor]